MVRSTYELKVPTNGMEQLGVAFKAVWDALDMRDVNRLVNSMRKRFQAFIATPKGQTRYLH